MINCIMTNCVSRSKIDFDTEYPIKPLYSSLDKAYTTGYFLHRYVLIRKHNISCSQEYDFAAVGWVRFYDSSVVKSYRPTI